MNLFEPCVLCIVSMLVQAVLHIHHMESVEDAVALWHVACAVMSSEGEGKWQLTGYYSMKVALVGDPVHSTWTVSEDFCQP